MKKRLIIQADARAPWINYIGLFTWYLRVSFESMHFGIVEPQWHMGVDKVVHLKFEMVVVDEMTVHGWPKTLRQGNMGSNYGVYNLEITQTQPNSCIKSSFKNFDRKRLRIHGVDYVCYPKLPHVHGSYIVATSHLRLCKYFQCRGDDIWVKNGTMFKCWEEVGLILGKHWEKLGVSYILAKLNV